MRKKELEQKLSECIYRVSALEKKLAQSEECILNLKDELEKKNFDDVYDFIALQKKEILDQLYENIGNRSNEIYDYINGQSQNRIEELNTYKKVQKDEIWMRTYGYDSMISQLQMSLIEERIKGNRDRLIALKDAYVGKKCFVIGNGPSLRAEDLTLLKENNVFCLASKGIYNIYGETEWRPDIWATSDVKYTEMVVDDVNKNVNSKKLVCAQTLLQKNIEINDAIYYPYIQNERTPRFFNKDIENGVHFYGSITCKLINFAAYMGFTEIYLLGCDNSTPIVKGKNGENLVDFSKKTHFSEFYCGDKEQDEKLFATINDIVESWKYIEKSFVDIKYFCDEMGIKIFNATRGGELEVFERISVEDIFHK